MKYVAGCGLMLLLVAGCGSSNADVGEIVYQIPKISATEKPYELPEIEGNPAPKAPPRAPVQMPTPGN